MATPTLFTSNRLESLARELAQTIRVPLSSPFSPEIIVVQSQSMARWLKLELAAQHGICANYLFPTPKLFARLAMLSALPEMPEDSAFEPESLTWTVFKQLPALLHQSEFASLKNYLGSDGDPRKLFQLSDKIARLFDQYIVFRPRMILDWDAGKGDGWQPLLWRNVAQSVGEPHLAALRTDFLNFAAKAGAKNPRVSIFGISALSQFYLELFSALAPHSQIGFYLLQPCAQWWGYICSDREAGKTLKHLGKKPADAAEFHLERGNRLLASLGKQGRDFLNLIHDLDWTEEERFEEPSADSLLHCIQSDIFNLEDRGANNGEKHAIAPRDNSIQVHNCHGPLREMEVLYDHLLDWFQNDPSLTPRDILVMTPDIETYAPFIQAVFDSPEQESQRIPISIADRGARKQSQMVKTFLNILALPQTRLGVTTILSLLETPALRFKFGLAGSDLTLIRSWIEETGIHWGKDATHRVALGLPAMANHTWKQGLDRLYEFARTGHKLLFAENLPALEKFNEFLRRVFETFEQLKSSRTLSGWADFLRDVLETFFQTSEQSENDFRTIRIALSGFSRNEVLSGFDGEIPLDILLEPLTSELNQDSSGAGYLTGGVTFCALKPMRSIPFKIICLIGMNDGTFPRTDSWPSFDLMAQSPRLGDRSSREDDRYLFLETIISAREKLYLSYTGQSIRDNSESPPSVLVNQLLDYIEQGFTLDAAPGVSPNPVTVTAHIVTKHRLQAFSPAYFSGGNLFSYSHENLSTSIATQTDRAAAKPFLVTPLSEPGNEFRNVTVESLAEFFCNPARFFATQRLGISLKKLESELEDDEPFTLDGLQNYSIKQQMLELRVSGQSPEVVRNSISSDSLPAGIPGQATLGNLQTDVEAFYERLKPHLPVANTIALPIDFTIGNFQVTGEFKDITSTGLLAYRCAKLKAKDLLRAWIRHAVWNVARPENQPLKTRLITEDKTYEFNETENPRVVLESLLQNYWRGLIQPLKFFPQTSLEFSEAGKLSSGVRVAWEGSDRALGERDDEYVDLFFRNTAALDDEFTSLAEEVFQPLLKHAKEKDL